ncbi:hypothetical protein Aple_053810 [Acrocarpospora pleiomorpha]|uniref:Uncharacterized protein n=1 Tax=Acrocarpospora pleiomorpha TaxID=90975 RepID=A0A5M3XML7_9ACTN|nr:hypothetical protein [Acrocarpospora pleiomorpha]GES22484.1 hypothetical protein Aple_053810 [Acrocarpospora pleiomorpha]
MDELQQVEEELASLRRQARELREQIGEGPTDPAEVAMLIANADQLDALAENMELRRQSLLNKR